MLLVVMFAMVSLAFEDVVVFTEALEPIVCLMSSCMKHNETEVFRAFVAVIETDLMSYF